MHGAKDRLTEERSFSEGLCAHFSLTSADEPFMADGQATDCELNLIRQPSDDQVMPLSAANDRLVRLTDITLAIIILVAILPVFVMVALAIISTDFGGLIFAHRRVGKDGKLFKCYKFRTMKVGAENSLAKILYQNSDLMREWERNQKLAYDPRVTMLGRFLRASCIDELPQLFNVIGGSMSLVGPRPIVPSELDRYGRYAPSYLGIRPGLTGLWQVTRKNNTTYRRRVATDVLYQRRKSFAFDMQIILATIPAVLAGEGAH